MEGRATFLVAGKVAFGVTFDVNTSDTLEDIQENAIDALRDYLDDNHVVTYAFRAKKADAKEENKESPEVMEVRSCCGEM